MSMVRVVYAVTTMMYFFGRGGVRHLGNLAEGRSSGWCMIGCALKRIRRLTALDEDTQEQVWKKFSEVRRTRRLIIESHHLESTATAVPHSV